MGEEVERVAVLEPAGFENVAGDLLPEKDASEADPRQLIHRALTYYANHRRRMNHAELGLLSCDGPGVFGKFGRR